MIVKPSVGAALNLDHPLAQGLVACFLLAEGSGVRTVDSSGMWNGAASALGYTGGLLENFSDPGTSSSGWYGSAQGGGLVFDGSNDQVDCGNADILNPPGEFTIIAWCRPAASQQNKAIVAKYAAGSAARAWALTTDTGASSTKVSFFYQRTGGSFTAGDALTSATALSTSALSQVACVFVPSTSATIYINGAQDAQDTTDIQAAIASTTAKMYMGRSVDGSTLFSGEINSVMVYRRALSAEEIAFLYAYPYCMFDEPDYPPWLYAVATFNAAWNVSANTMIQPGALQA